MTPCDVIISRYSEGGGACQIPKQNRVKRERARGALRWGKFVNISVTVRCNSYLQMWLNKHEHTARTFLKHIPMITSNFARSLLCCQLVAKLAATEVLAQRHPYCDKNHFKRCDWLRNHVHARVGQRVIQSQCFYKIVSQSERRERDLLECG